MGSARAAQAVREVRSVPPGERTQRRRGSLVLFFLRNPVTVLSILLVAGVVFSAVFAPLLATHPPTVLDIPNAFAPPSRDHWFGTDSLGRDVYSRLIHGTRYALLIGVVAVAVGLIPGTLLGLASGYWGGPYDLVIMRATDLMLSFPYLLVAIVIVSLLGPSLTNAIIAVGIYNIALFLRLVRASVLAVRSLEYIDAARVVGASDAYILRRHVLPNVLTPVIVQATLSFPRAILSASSLGFLGLGAQPPIPEWGTEVAANRQYFALAPHTVFFPSFAIAIVAMAFNFLGDGLRDLLDPQMRGRR